MAVCDLATLRADACASGFFGLDEKSARAIELQLWSTLAGNTLTVAQLATQACANGFLAVDRKDFREIEMQILCNLSGGESSSDVPTCLNLIPDGATYGGNGDGSRWNLNGGGATAVVTGSTYQLTWGLNDNIFHNGTVSYFNPGVGQTTTFVALPSVYLNGTNGNLVTATICEI
jgi:hypothetical protein